MVHIINLVLKSFIFILMSKWCQLVMVPMSRFPYSWRFGENFTHEFFSAVLYVHNNNSLGIKIFANSVKVTISAVYPNFNTLHVVNKKDVERNLRFKVLVERF